MNEMEQAAEHFSAAMVHPLEPLVNLLRVGTACNRQSLRGALADLAQWRLACGDLQGAAHWQRLSLSAADPAAVRKALRPLLADRPDLCQLLSSPEDDWLPLQRALARGHYQQAGQLQATLLEEGGDPPPESLVDTLLRCWLQAGQPQHALALLDACPSPLRSANRLEDAALAAAIGWALHQANRSNEARRWWAHSLVLEPEQQAVAVAMRACNCQQQR